MFDMVCSDQIKVSI